VDIDHVAPSRRFYAGGGASIRGFGYNLVGPRNNLGEPKGGRSLYEFSLEARVNTRFFGGALQLVPFFDAGGVEADVMPKFNDWRYGAGLGIRYRTGFGPIRIDVGTPLNPRAGTAGSASMSRWDRHSDDAGGGHSGRERRRRP
jgi:translocation and assembly module TamA